MSSMITVILLLTLFRLLHSDNLKSFTTDDQGYRLHWCTPENLPFQSIHENIVKFLQGDGSLSIGYNHCHIRNFEGRHFHDVHRAMRGNHLLFLGDSLSRYTYLSLAYYMAYRKWVASYPHQTNDLSPLVEKGFEGWAHFYKFTNALLNRHGNITKTELSQHPYASYEVCDCRRSDKWLKGVEISENRHFRVVPSLPIHHFKAIDNGTLYHLQGNLDDRTQDIRLSYVQWFGFNSVKAHKLISNVPRNKADFQQYIDTINTRYCSSEEDKRLYPISSSCITHRLGHYNGGVEVSDLNYAFPGDDNAGQCPSPPMRKEHTEKPCHMFGELFPLMNVTHMLANTGIWATLHMFHPSFLNTTVRAARLYSQSIQHQDEKHIAKHSRESPNWKLKPIVWRQTYSTRESHNVFSSNEEKRELQMASKFLEESRAAGYDDFDVFPSNLLTKHYHDLHYFRGSDGKSHHDAWKDIVLSVDFLRAKQLLGWVRSHKLSSQYNATSWKDVAESEEERFYDKYRGIPGHSDMGKEIIDQYMSFGKDIGEIYVDCIHFLPYVYNEINKVFLSSTVPLVKHKRYKQD